MENSEMRSNKKKRMAPAKPPLIPMSSFQELQKIFHGNSASTTSSPSQAPNENMVENHPARHAVSAASIGDSNSSKVSDQIQTAEPDDMDEKHRRRESNRLSSRRSWQKKSSYKANLESQVNNIEDQIAEYRSQLAFHRTKKKLLILEQQTLQQDMDILRKDMILRDVEIQNNGNEVKRLKELQLMQQKQKQMQPQLPPDWDTGLQEPLYNDPISNFSASSYHADGNGVETQYMPPEATQMWTPFVPNMQTILDQMVEHQLQVASHRMTKQFDIFGHETLPHEMDICQKEIILQDVAGNEVQTSYILPELDQKGIPAMPTMHEMNLSLPNYMGSMDINHSSSSFSNPNLN